MYRYLIRRLLWAGVLFLAVTIVSYIIFFLVPAEPARLIAGPQAPPDQVERVRKQMGFDDPVVRPVRPIPRRADADQLRRRSPPQGPLARPLVRDAPAGHRDHQGRRARHRLARLRRGDPLDADRGADRDPLGAPAAIAVRPIGNGVRPDRDLRASRLDRPDPHLLRRVQGGVDAARGLLRHDQPVDRLRRAGRVGTLAHPSLDHVRDPLRRSLRPNDPCERPGSHERGLRAHGPREGGARVARHALARACGTRCSRS